VDLLSHLSIVLEHDGAEEMVVVTAEDDFSHLRGQVVEMLQVNSVAVDAEQLMDHRLVSPLVEEGSHGIFLPVKDEEVCPRRVTGHLGHKLLLSVHLGLYPLSELLAERAIRVEPHEGIRSRCHQEAEDSVDDTVGRVLLGDAPRARW